MAVPRKKASRPVGRQSPQSLRRREWPPAWVDWRLAAIVLAGLLSYGGGLSHPFMFDDLGSVVLNPQVRTFELSRALSPPPETPVGGRPLVNLSFALNHAWGGLDVGGYHAVNIALHVACGLLVFGLLRRLVVSAHAEAVAFAVALLWTVHPLNSEVVNYLTQRTESMMALCYLLTQYSAARALSGSARGKWEAAAIVACGAGMACKESMISAPLMVVLIDRVFAYGSLREAWSARRRLYVGLAASWIVLAVLVAAAPRTPGAGFATTHVSSWTYLLSQSEMIVRYLRLVVWPDSLVLYYGWATPATIAGVWPFLLAVGAVLGGALWLFVKNPRVGVYALWVFIALAPTSSLVPIASEVGAERRMYLPLVGILSLAALGVAALFERRGPRSTLPAAFTGGAVALACILGVTTAARTREYASPLTMARTVLERWPTASAHHMVGTELVNAGDSAAAIPHLREAAAQIPPARFNLGQALINTGNVDEGIVELERFVREEPDQVTTRDARLLLARAYTETSRGAQAIEPLTQILTGEPSDAAARGLLAEALAADGQWDAAIPHYRAFVAARPQDAGGWTGLGIALISSGRPSEAIDAFGAAVRAAPGNVGFRVNLARVLLGEGRAEEALEHARAAAALSPGDPAIRELIRAAGGS